MISIMRSDLWKKTTAREDGCLFDVDGIISIQLL